MYKYTLPGFEIIIMFRSEEVKRYYCLFLFIYLFFYKNLRRNGDEVVYDRGSGALWDTYIIVIV